MKTDKRLVCIANNVKGDAHRLTVEECNEIIANDSNYHFTSKAKYERYIASLQPKFYGTGGAVDSKYKIKRVASFRIKRNKRRNTFNNRKRTPGRQFMYLISKSIRLIKDDFTARTHSAILHLVGHDSLINTDIYTKEGKGVETSRRTVLSKHTTLKNPDSSKLIRHI